MTDPADLRHDDEKRVANEDSKTPRASNTRRKTDMHANAPPTTVRSRIAFTERPHRAAFMTARDYQRLRDDPERTAANFWIRGRWP